MKILLVAATELEIAPTIDWLKGNRAIGSLVQPEIVITGIGASQAAYHTARNIYQHAPTLLIQAGIGGTFTDTLAPGSVAWIEKDAFGDVGMLEQNSFAPIFTTPLAEPNQPPYSEGWLVNPYNWSELLDIPMASGVTINTISDSTQQKAWLQQHFNAAVESMEGAAFHYVCLQERKPFIQLRGVSNEVGIRDRSRWAMKPALESLNHQLQHLLQTMAAQTLAQQSS